MRIGEFDFRPGLVPTLATVLVLPVLIGLGLWQLDRAVQKRELLRMYDERMQQSAVELDDRVDSLERLRYRQVQVLGRFDRTRTILLDNRVHEGVAGYEVFSPLQIAGSNTLILVNRGWIPLGRDRNVLPRIETPAETLQVRGVLSPPPGHGITLGAEAVQGEGWPQVVPYIDMVRLEQVLGARLLPMVVQLAPEAEYGFARAWKLVEMGPERHLGYAFQWFALAFALFLTYVVVNTRRAGGGSEVGSE